MAQNINIVVYPVKDLEKAKTFFTKYLAVEPYVDGHYYVGYKAGNMEVGLVPGGQKEVIAYTDTMDIKSTLEGLVATGVVVEQDIKDVGGGLLVASVKDESGNVLGLRQSPTEA